MFGLDWKDCRGNKDAKAIQLDNELRNITIGDSTLTEHCTRIMTMANLLDNIDAAVPEKNLVMYTINDLSPKFEYIASLIRDARLCQRF